MLTALMAAVLIVSFLLMFGLVQFSESIITRPKSPVTDALDAQPQGTENRV